MYHIPVMVEEVMKYLDVKAGGTYVDGTAGAGGHLQKIIERAGESGKVIAIDQNKAAIEHIKEVLRQAQDDNVLKVVRGNYKFIKTITDQFGVTGSVDGVLLDLGFSSDEIQEEGRGFSFYDTESLDMRYGQGEHGEWLCDCHTPEFESLPRTALDAASGLVRGRKSKVESHETNKKELQASNFKLQDSLSAEEVVNTSSESDLADIFWKYGDETKSRFFAKKIIEYRKRHRIQSAAELAYIIGNPRPTPDAYRVLSERTHALRASRGGSRRDIGISRGKIHPATKAFMALRIFVNREFENIELGLAAVVNVLRSKGRCVVLTFHSGEDRIVKKFIAQRSAQGDMMNLTKHVVKPSRTEVLSNRLSRSAKLRVFIKK